MTEENKEKLYDILYQYFEIGDSDCYHLTRDKSGFAIGTVTLDDFVEFDEDTIDDIVEYIAKKWDE